ncbi:MAG: sensor histidine kinase [Betaproteobacteria bacterium]
MAAIAAAATPESAAPTAADGTLRAEFVRVFNLRSIGLVLALCMLLALSRWMLMAYAEPAEKWLLGGLKFLRQNAISGVSMLFAVALAHAVAVSRGWNWGRSFRVGLAAALAAALVGALLRLLVFGTPLATIPQRWPWALGVVALWGLFGAAAVAMLRATWEQRQAQRALVDARCTRDTLEAQHLQATLSALQAQIEPHFLFNTLANVKRLYETAPERGRDMLASLIDYLRAALPTLRQQGSTVARELELARAYLTILQMRMGERLAFAIDVAPGLESADVPPLVLPTLLENAVQHGLAPLPQGGRIDVIFAREADALLLTVADTGRGFGHAGSGGSGVGLANTRARLAALYGPPAALTLAPNPAGGVIATVRLPLRLAQAHG